jgi:hypothetical protein
MQSVFLSFGSVEIVYTRQLKVGCNGRRRANQDTPTFHCSPSSENQKKRLILKDERQGADCRSNKPQIPKEIANTTTLPVIPSSQAREDGEKAREDLFQPWNCE